MIVISTLSAVDTSLLKNLEYHCLVVVPVKVKSFSKDSKRIVPFEKNRVYSSESLIGEFPKIRTIMPKRLVSLCSQFVYIFKELVNLHGISSFYIGKNHRHSFYRPLGSAGC